jgi:hypothetical protein
MPATGGRKFLIIYIYMMNKVMVFLSNRERLENELLEIRQQLEIEKKILADTREEIEENNP